MIWNKTRLSFVEKRKLRKLFFQNRTFSEIENKTKLKSCVVRRIAKENNWYSRRERYWLFLCNVSYNKNISIMSMADNVGILWNLLHRIKRKYGIKTKRFNPANKKMTKEMEDKIIKDYKNCRYKSAKDISLAMGFKTAKTVLDVLKKNNVAAKSSDNYTDYNTGYFEKIDTHDKAYILGFLLTDGYVIKNYEGFAMDLSYKDRDILKKIKKRVGKSCSMMLIKNKGRRDILGRSCKRKNMMRLSCHSHKISQDLRKYNLIKNKTKVLQFPTNIPKRLYSSFFRGIFDGDGTVGINSQTNFPWCQFVGYNRTFMEDSKNVLVNLGYKIGLSLTCFPTLYIKGGRSEIKRFLKWVYKNRGEMFLERKYARYKKM